MAWGNGAALYGGQSATVDDTATGDNAGPGDTYVSVTVSGADVGNVHFGFAYNLIVNKDDDSNAVTVRSKQGSLRQFIKNANAIGTAGGTTANFSQFRIPAGLLVGGIATIQPPIALPTLTDNGTTLDATTQATNIGDTNGVGPEIEIYGGGLVIDGFNLTSANNTIRGFLITRFNDTTKRAIRITGAGATNNTIAGNYIGTNFSGAAADATTSNAYGVGIEAGAASNTIGGTAAADRNLISGNAFRGVLIDGVGTNTNQVLGNYIGTNAAGTAAVANDAGIAISGGAQSNIIGSGAAGGRNVISGNTNDAIGIGGSGTNANVVKGNYIGLDVNGANGLANGGVGVSIYSGAQSTQVGGTGANEGNLISSNTLFGVWISGSGSDSNTVQGNYIGTDVTGILNRGNGSHGIYISSAPNSNTVGGTGAGEANRIAFNGGDGVAILFPMSGGDFNRISGNRIFSNTGLGIDLDPDGVGASGGANQNKAAPTIGSITPSGGNFTIVATVGSGDTIEFFRVNNGSSPAVSLDGSGSGEGYLFLGACVDNGACSGSHVSAVADANPAAGTVQATLLTSGVNGGDFVSATATDASNNTSEFSANSQVPLNLVKQVWQVGGTALLAKSNGAPSSVTVPSGETVVFLIYVKNPGSSDATDIRFSDLLDVSASGFDYVVGSLVRDDGSLSDAATDLQIFNATAPGTGTVLTDAADGDVGSACTIATGLCPGAAADRVTAGNTTGLTPVQANGTLSVPANKTFAIRFRAVKK
jgi:uncharacterized repeat protein (TIGR01451 family)